MVFAAFSVMEKQELLLQLALRLKELRKLKDVTQEEVHNETGIHVARIEEDRLDGLKTKCSPARAGRHTR